MKEVELLVFHSNEIKVYQNHALKTFISACPVQDPTMVRAVAMSALAPSSSRRHCGSAIGPLHRTGMGVS